MFNATITSTTSPSTTPLHTPLPRTSMKPAQVAFGYSNSHSGTVSTTRSRSVQHIPQDTKNDAMNHASNIFHAFSHSRYIPTKTLYSYLQLSRDTSDTLVTFYDDLVFFIRVPFLGVAMLADPMIANHFLQQTFNHSLVNEPSKEFEIYGGNTSFMWALSQAFRAKDAQALLNLKTNLLCLIDRIVETDQVKTLLHKNNKGETAQDILNNLGFKRLQSPTPEMQKAMQDLQQTLTEKLESVFALFPSTIL